MSSEYPGLPKTAWQYCQSYLRWAIGFTMLVLFTGALGSLVILEFFPEAAWFYILAAVSFVIHLAALITRDVWRGEYEPSQTTYGTVKVLLVIIVLLGIYISTLVGLGGLIGYALSVVGMPLLLAAIGAAYYPIADVILERRGFPTPGKFVKMCSIIGVGTLIDFHRSAVESLPVFGKRERPQS